jgi:hypothetical protein
MSETRYFIAFIAVIFLGLVAQFLIFRTPFVYNLSFKTHLFNTAWWVEKPAKVIVAGGSSAMNDVIPNVITELSDLEKGEVINLGMNGASVVETKVSYEKYVKRFGHPDKVYYVVTPLFFYDSFLFKKNYEKIYLNFSQWKALQQEGYPNHYFFPVALFFKSLEFHRDYNFRDYHFDLQMTRQNFGFQPNVSVEFSKEVTDRFLPRQDDDFGLSQPLMNVLKEWVQALDQNGVELILLQAPYHQVLYQKYLESPMIFQEFFDAASDIFGPRVILGSYDPEFFAMSDHHFLNLDHLSAKGAEVYTKAIYSNYMEHSNLQEIRLTNTLKK